MELHRQPHGGAAGTVGNLAGIWREMGVILPPTDSRRTLTGMSLQGISPVIGMYDGHRSAAEQPEDAPRSAAIDTRPPPWGLRSLRRCPPKPVRTAADNSRPCASSGRVTAFEGCTGRAGSSGERVTSLKAKATGSTRAEEEGGNCRQTAAGSGSDGRCGSPRWSRAAAFGTLHALRSPGFYQQAGPRFG
jgi:hypothetical protein